MALAGRLGIPVREERVPRELLYVADEIFFTGTAAEVTPIRSVDKIVVGNGARGPITEQIQRSFFDVVECRVPDEFGWLTFVTGSHGTRVAAAQRSSAR
jgi:branched-chain amino acid aminotransferase